MFLEIWCKILGRGLQAQTFLTQSFAGLLHLHLSKLCKLILVRASLTMTVIVMMLVVFMTVSYLRVMVMII